MNEDRINLSGDVYKSICAHAEAEYPNEACGIVFAKDGSDGEMIYEKAENVDPDIKKRGHFSIDPIKLFELEEEYSQKGFSIAGFAHSHPDAACIPSHEDEKNMIPGLLYLIAGVNKGKYNCLRIWKKDTEDNSTKEIFQNEGSDICNTSIVF